MQIAEKTYLNFIDFSRLSNWSSYALLGNSLLYTQKYPFVRIGVFLKRNKEQILIQDEVLYKRATIRTNGQGVKLRDEIYGKSIGTKNQFRIHKGQFLLSKIDARNGAFGVVPERLENGIITGNFWTFDVDYDKINPHYLTLLTTTKEFQKLSQTASVGTTNRNYLQESLFLNFQIPLPTIQEQEKILKDYQSKIEEVQNLNQQANDLEIEIERYLNKTLEYKTNSSNTSDVNGFLKFIDYGTIEKWGVEKNNTSKLILTTSYEVRKIKDLCDVSSGGTPSRNKREYYYGNIPWIKTGEVLNNIIYDTEEKITQEAIENSSAKIYPKESLIIAMYGQGLTRGRTAKLGIDASTNQACAVLFNIKTDLILTDFLWIYLMGEYHRLRELASGNNQPNLNAQIIKDYKVIIPPFDIQKQIIENFKNLKEKIKQLKAQAKQLKFQAEEEFEQTIFR